MFCSSLILCVCCLTIICLCSCNKVKNSFILCCCCFIFFVSVCYCSCENVCYPTCFVSLLFSAFAASHCFVSALATMLETLSFSAVAASFFSSLFVTARAKTFVTQHVLFLSYFLRLLLHILLSLLVQQC